MMEQRSADEIIRLGKLNFSPELRAILEEAIRALAAGCLLEAEALLQNIEARFNYAQMCLSPDVRQPVKTGQFDSKSSTGKMTLAKMGQEAVK